MRAVSRVPSVAVVPFVVLAVALAAVAAVEEAAAVVASAAERQALAGGVDTLVVDARTLDGSGWRSVVAAAVVVVAAAGSGRAESGPEQMLPGGHEGLWAMVWSPITITTKLFDRN